MLANDYLSNSYSWYIFSNEKKNFDYDRGLILSIPLF
jgi:hypothetical protein